MFVKEMRSGDLIRVDQVAQLANPLDPHVLGRRQAGEEEQDEQLFEKADLVFPSDEPLPACWTEKNYQVKERMCAK
ncbi:hypothetical protein UC8_07270 [Roseimaritima ulvae]|uniref:Acetyltransferase n=2 Tax=Roseimaritima ulvae TaxID=980254 RepID=A0A5B9QL75_9BACT|nr:hypothetical protein UC8_07270 [Roseimaritima ulvae]